MDLFFIAPKFVDRAWSDGAHLLSEACKKAEREITPDQLKQLLSRGERTLVCGRENGETVAWVVIDFVQMPNTRALYIYQLHAPGHAGDALMGELKKVAEAEGCSSIRGACDEVGERLWRGRFGAKRLYAVCEVIL
jgi:hypothetical protein